MTGARMTSAHTAAGHMLATITTTASAPTEAR